MKPANDHVKQMLDDLGRALVSAISSSRNVTEAVRRMRHQGYGLNLVLSCHQDGSATRLELTAAATQSTPQVHEPPARAPAFRLAGSDVALLKSLGIDATRPGRQRRRPS